MDDRVMSSQELAELLESHLEAYKKRARIQRKSAEGQTGKFREVILRYAERTEHMAKETEITLELLRKHPPK